MANFSKIITIVFLGLLIDTSLGFSQGLKIQRVCGFDKVIDSIYLINAHDPTPLNRRIIDDILRGVGKKGQYQYMVVATESANVPYAITGLAYASDKKSVLICIVINETGLDDFTVPKRIVILTHEIGHITDGDFTTALPITKTNELGADYQSGFFSAIFGVRPIEDLLDPYKNLRPDAVHPPFADRSVKLNEGYSDGLRATHLVDTLDPEKHHGIVEYFPPSDSVVLKAPLELAQFIRPNGKSIFSKTRWYDVILRVISTSPNLSNNDLYSHIKEVKYFIDEPTFPHQQVASDHRENGFQYILKSYGDDYKVFATVVFDDGSTASGLSVTVKFPDLGQPAK